ncbi:uncharacterized protein LOC129748607 [Uranotaenia lowii]|uniref:uncharacterized protein LOC129748607 n=1 Tax=Uranotaenia lowii TaxID=190385 RepID=UPI002478B15D|nr:uncharacterized protein LOC129748607 [Uranotaenia lowii]
MSASLLLRRPTAYSKLLESIPKPEGALPKHGGIPQWKHLSLDQKLPANACPIHPPQFFRGHLGEFLWTKPDDYGFDLTDPLEHDVSFRYVEMSDPNLEIIFRDEKLKNILRERKFINERDEIICSLRQFNRLRYYLWKLHKHEIKKAYREMDETWKLNFSRKKLAEHMDKFYDFEGKLQRKRCKVYQMRLAKRQRALQIKEAYEEQMARYFANKSRKYEETMAENRSQYARVKYNYRLLKASRKSYYLRLKRRLREQHEFRMRRLSILKKRIQESKKLLKKERHKLFYLSAQEADAERKTLLKNLMQQMHKNVERRMVQSKRRQDRIERQLTHRKTQNLTKKYEKRSKDVIAKAILKAWNSIAVRQPDMAKVSRASIETAVNVAYNIHMTLGKPTSSTAIIDTAKQLINDFAKKPCEELPVDHLTIRYTHDALVRVILVVKEEIIKQGCLKIEQIATKMRDRIEEKPPTNSALCGPWSVKRAVTLQSGSFNRVSIGEVEIVEKIDTERKNLKQSRYRPPTPVASVSSLAEHILLSEEDDDDDEFDSDELLVIPSSLIARVEKSIADEDHPLIHLTTSQKRYLELNICKFRTFVQRNALIRAMAAIDVQSLEIVRRKMPKPKRTLNAIVEDAARSILLFPKQEQEYAHLLHELIEFVVWEVCEELEGILNEP